MARFSACALAQEAFVQLKRKVVRNIEWLQARRARADLWVTLAP